MTDYKIHTVDSAPEASKALLGKVGEKYGFIPNLMGLLAESPATLEAYATLSGIFEKSDFSPVDQQVILLTVNRFNECPYCMAAHSTIAKGAGMKEATLEALRAGKALPDARQNALAEFTRNVVEQRGWVSAPDVKTFLAAGFTKANVLEVILGASFKTISNFANHIAKTPVDEAFAGQSWSKDGAKSQDRNPKENP